MSTERVDKALDVLPAIGTNAADATGATGVMRVATTTSSAAHTIPAGMRGKWVRLLTVGTNTQYVITRSGETAPTLVYNQASAFGTGHAAAGATLVDSVPERVRIPSTATTITVISAAATGFFSANVSGRK